MRHLLATLPLLFALSAACDGGDEHEHEHDSGSMEDLNETAMAMTDGGSFHVKYTLDPSTITVSEPFDMTFTISAADAMDTPLTDATATADANMPAHGHGMNVEPTATDNGDGTTTVSGMVFHMPGHWEVVVDVTEGDTTEQAIFDIVLE